MYSPNSLRNSNNVFIGVLFIGHFLIFCKNRVFIFNYQIIFQKICHPFFFLKEWLAKIGI